MQRLLVYRVALATLAGIALGAGCGSESTPPGDTTPPGSITDLAAVGSASTTVTLAWTAPGDDDSSGTAARYDVRYSTFADSTDTYDRPAWWDSLTVAVSDSIVPAGGGEAESLTVTGLMPASSYFFALEAFDENGNASGLSNVASGATTTGPKLSNLRKEIDFDTTQTASSFPLSNEGTETLTWSVLATTDTWISTDPSSGSVTTEKDTIAVTVDRSGLEAGSHTGYVRISSNGGSDSVRVKLVVVTDPLLRVKPLSLDFGSDQTELSFAVRNAGADTLVWTASSDSAWIALDPASGSAMSDTDSVSVVVDRADLEPGTHIASVFVTAGSQVETVTVSVNVSFVPGVVSISSGSFTMGDGAAHCGATEHMVYLTTTFHLGRYEITNDDYRRALQWAYENEYVRVDGSSVLDSLDGGSALLFSLDDPANRLTFDAGSFGVESTWEDHPIVGLSWFGAAAYCDWLSLSEGLERAYDHATWACHDGDPYGAGGFRLPTEAEWEYAARYNDERIYPWGNEDPDCTRANYLGCAGDLQPVGSYPGAPAINGGALYDMAGNAWEWCNDYWAGCDLGTRSAIDPAGPSSGGDRALRGGAWANKRDAGEGLRAAYRGHMSPDLPGSSIGFRIARSQ